MLLIKDRKLPSVYNFLGLRPQQKFISPEFTPGTLLGVVAQGPGTFVG